jgi:uncharacterized membrane protein YoaK (UPF0700 family)
MRDDAANAWSWRSPIGARNLLLVMLAFTSGYVDTVSYLGLGKVFTSNMTGNTVLLGLALGQANGLAALRSFAALVGYLVGVVIGSAIADRVPRRTIWPHAVTTACAVELVVLLVFTVWGTTAGASATSSVICLLIALAAIAMGIQSVAARTLGVSGVATTYITGTWTSLLSGLTQWLLRALRVSDATSGQSQPTNEPPHGASVQAAVVCVYLVAAVAGGAAELRWRLAAGLVPTVVVALVVMLALFRFQHEESEPGVSDQVSAHRKGKGTP